MFSDEVKVVFEGGRGGDGFVSFHREKFVAAGAPDGGDGGNGGNIVLVADSNFNTLGHYVGPKNFKAESGKNGHKNNMAGRAGVDLILKVPPGTQVFDDESGALIVDLINNGDSFKVCEGGRGGYGNAHFVSSIRQAPHFAELGDEGERKHVRLELKLLADVGLVGFPSSGKSTLISHVSAAKPKIGDYPFTTLQPNLGVVNLKEFGGSKNQTFVIADIPGLIEGASLGKGLGDRFLRHISRTGILIFLLDPFSYDGVSIEDQYKILNKELGAFDSDMLSKEFLVVINKIDAIPDEDRNLFQKTFIKKFPKLKSKIRLISGVSGENLSELMKELWRLSSERKDALVSTDTGDDHHVYEPIRLIEDNSFSLSESKNIDLGMFSEKIHGQLISSSSMPNRKLFVVSGRRIEQISRMTNVSQKDAITRIYDVLMKMGIYDKLQRGGAVNGDLILIGPHYYEFHEL